MRTAVSGRLLPFHSIGNQSHHRTLQGREVWQRQPIHRLQGLRALSPDVIFKSIAFDAKFAPSSPRACSDRRNVVAADWQRRSFSMLKPPERDANTLSLIHI